MSKLNIFSAFEPVHVEIFCSNLPHHDKMVAPSSLASSGEEDMWEEEEEWRLKLQEIRNSKKCRKKYAVGPQLLFMVDL